MYNHPVYSALPPSPTLQNHSNKRGEGDHKQQPDKCQRRPPAIRASRVLRREEDFAGRQFMEAARGSPVHRQMAADGKFAPAPVAARQHGVGRLLRDDASGQFPWAFPDDFSDPTRPSRPQRDTIARALHLAGGAVTAHFGLNATALRLRQLQHTIQSSAATKKTNAQTPPTIRFMERVSLVVWRVFFMEWLVGAVAYFIVIHLNPVRWRNAVQGFVRIAISPATKKGRLAPSFFLPGAKIISSPGRLLFSSDQPGQRLFHHLPSDPEL